ncbi:FeoA family protein [Nannocystaceae bacterium ST9]
MPFQPGGTLADLQIGARAIVKDVEGEGRMAVRLLEMGFVPGVEVALIKRAPLGDPLELRLRGYHVSLRRAEARAIRVEALSEVKA